MNIQWFPGHMAKTRRILTENLKLIDVVVELLDARIPRSSKNPEIDQLIGVKPRVIALNKEDLANKEISKKWKSHFNNQGIDVVFINSLNGSGMKELQKLLIDKMKDKFERDKEKGRIRRAVRTMVIGIPNVGKSSLINRLSGSSAAITGDKPGVTRSKQWIRINKDIELLDMPGLLWPKFDDEEVASNLAFTGAIKDDVLDIEEIAVKFVERLMSICPTKLEERYKVKIEEQSPLELFEEIARKRGCIISGGNIDLRRISVILLDEFRGGKIGKITLEMPC